MAAAFLGALGLALAAGPAAARGCSETEAGGMSEQATNADAARAQARARRWQAGAGRRHRPAGGGDGAAVLRRLLRARIGQEQPIPFSHRVHAGVKEISCLMCHPGAADSGPRAGVPPLQTCMLCHEHIIIALPADAEERLRLRRGPARRVGAGQRRCRTSSTSTTRCTSCDGIDCGHCHGDVKGMDRVKRLRRVQMGFCVQCHRDNGASHDCLTSAIDEGTAMLDFTRKPKSAAVAFLAAGRVLVRRRHALRACLGHPPGRAGVLQQHPVAGLRAHAAGAREHGAVRLRRARC